MIIRKAASSDFEQISTLKKELRHYRGSIHCPETTEFHAKNEPVPVPEENGAGENIVFVAVAEDSRIVGFIQGSVHMRDQHLLSRLGSLDVLYVTESYRQKGVAQKLFAALEQAWRDHSCDHCVTHTDIENTRAQMFYTKMGMRQTTVEFWKKL